MTKTDDYGLFYSVLADNAMIGFSICIQTNPHRHNHSFFLCIV